MKKTRKLIAAIALSLFATTSVYAATATTIDAGESCILFKKLIKKYNTNTPKEFLKIYPLESPLYVTNGDSKYNMSKAVSEIKLYSNGKRLSFGITSTTAKGFSSDGGEILCRGVSSIPVDYPKASIYDQFKPLLIKNTRTSYAKRLSPNEIGALARKIKETADKYTELADPLYYRSDNDKTQAIKKAKVGMERLLNNEQFRKLFVTFLDQFKNDYYEYQLYVGEIFPDELDLGAPPDETNLYYLFSMEVMFRKELSGKNLNLYLYSGYDKGDGSEFRFNVDNIIKWLIAECPI